MSSVIHNRKKKKGSQTVTVHNPYTGRTQRSGEKDTKTAPTKAPVVKRAKVSPNAPTPPAQGYSKQQQAYVDARERLRAEGKTGSKNIEQEQAAEAQRFQQEPIMTPPSFPVEEQLQQETTPQENTLALVEGQDESFFDRVATTLQTGEISQDAGFDREVNLKDLSQIALTGVGIGAAAIFAGAGSAALISRAAAGQAVKTINRFGVNSKMAAKTGSWVGRMFKGIVKNPAGAASTVLATVGTYPFAGFIKEEALQTLGFAGKNALDNGDLEGAAAAIQATQEVLNPSVWNQILAAIPSANILKQVQNYLVAAEIQTKTQAKRYEKLRAKEEESFGKEILPEVPR